MAAMLLLAALKAMFAKRPSDAGSSQIEVSSSKYIAHSLAQQKAAATKETGARAVPSHEQVMGQLGELDKLGQEGAVPVDDAEVQ